jgi:hypothetical protein
MTRYLFPLLILLSLSFSACVLPALDNQQPVQPDTQTPMDALRASPLDTSVVTAQGTAHVTVQPTPTDAEIFATQALAATLSEPTPTLTPTLRVLLPELRSGSAGAAIPGPDPEYRYNVQAGTPVMTANFIDPDAGCDWLGLGGQVFSRNDDPVTGLIVEVGGTLDEQPVLHLALTGGSTRLGPGGYEILLADRPVDSQGTLWLQLYDLGGEPLSDQIFFDTDGGLEACDKNLIIINFSEVGPSIWDYYFPYMFKDASGR